MCCCVHSSSASNKSLIYWSTFMAAAQSKVLDLHRVIFLDGCCLRRETSTYETMPRPFEINFICQMIGT